MKSCGVVGFGFKLLVGTCLVVTSLAACAGDAAPEPKTAAAAPAASAEPSVAPANDARPELAAAADQAKPAADEKPALAPPQDPNAAPGINYVVTPDGLQIEVAGVRFLASAEAKQIGPGWGVKVTVKAESTDGKDHLLFSPNKSPMEFFASIHRQNGGGGHKDGRGGEGELKLPAGSPTTFSREFPSKGEPALASGDGLDLQVGLWGLGESADARRPVKPFFHVTMKVDKGKPQALVEPPATAAK